MKTTICLLTHLLLAAPLFATNVTIHIGDTPLSIPSPPGFVPVTSDMGRLDQVLDSFVVPQNVRFVSFIPEALLPALNSGKIPSMPRTLSVQTARTAVKRLVTLADFAELKKTVREQNAGLREKMEKEMPGMLERMNQRIEDRFNTRLNMNVNGMVPLPAHEESDRSMAFSMLINMSMNQPNGTPTNFAGVVTATFLLAKGKLFFLYVNGGENDLEWTRTLSKNWATAILAANPSDAATAALEAKPASGFDWNLVMRSALIGAAIGGLFGLVRFVTRRSRGT